jgi:hypothetical protein
MKATHSTVNGSQVRRVGRRRLVLDLSCRQRRDAYLVVTDRWQRFSELAVDEATLAGLATSCDEFLVSCCFFDAPTETVQRIFQGMWIAQPYLALSRCKL